MQLSLFYIIYLLEINFKVINLEGGEATGELRSVLVPCAAFFEGSHHSPLQLVKD